MTTRRDRSSQHSDLLSYAREWARAALSPNTETVLLVGSRLTTVVPVVLEHAPAARAVVIDPDGTATEAERLSSSTGSAALAILSGPDYAGTATIARQFANLHNSPVLVDPELAESAPEMVERAKQVLERLRFQASANDDARRASAGRYLLHTLANGARIAREGNATALAGQLTGVPAIIVAAGPSLDQNVHDLAPIRDRAVVIACDTAARSLLSVGIDPDLVVAADSSRANAAHLSAIPPSKSWLVAEPSVHPSTFAHFERRTFMFRVASHHPWPWLMSLGLDRGVLDTWGSVATTAFSLALTLNCGPIIFMGADFAFTDDRPYCRGTSLEGVWSMWAAGGAPYSAIWKAAIDKWPVTTATDVHGQPARTAPHLLTFRDWIVERAGEQAWRGLFNATGAGLLHGGGFEDRTATDVLRSAPVLQRELVHAALQRAHDGSRGDLTRFLTAGSAIVNSGDPGLVRDWQAFSGGGVTTRAIQSALATPELTAWLAGLQAALAVGAAS
jgi:hypothetical protein